MTVAVSAHKGGSEDATPATWEAYQTALTTGAEYIEFDIRRTRDGDLVVFHDAHVAGRLVGDLTYEELCAVARHRVPLVREVMKLIAGKAIGHLDLKEDGGEEEVIKLALATLGEGNFVATTLLDASIHRIKKSFPEVTAALSLGRDLREVARFMRLPARARELYPWRGCAPAGPTGSPCTGGWPARTSCGCADGSACRPWCGRSTRSRRCAACWATRGWRS